MKKKYIIGIILAILVIAIIGFLIYLSYKKGEEPIEVNKDFKSIDISNVSNVMFVAHPDDDAIWGGSHLLQDGKEYLVVCITCGVVAKRALEFEQAMDKIGSKYIMLGWPDKTNGEKDNWDTSKEGIKKDIKEILALKDWNLVVTHNPEGEYGHIHHKMTNNIVTDLADHKKLMYFGKYYPKTTIDDYKESMVEIESELLKNKEEYIGIYKSQDFVFDMFGHMFPYESWMSYEEWYAEG